MVLCGRLKKMVDGTQCAGVLYARPDAEFVTCGECQARHVVQERRQHMVDAVAVLDVTKVTALIWVRVLMNQDIPDGTWRYWRSKGKVHVTKISVEGRELFRFGQVRELATAWVARKRVA
jgi:hypothetical protein